MATTAEGHRAGSPEGRDGEGKVEVVVGREATIRFDPDRCIHSRACVLSHPDVFVPNVQGEWIHPDAQPLGELVRIGQNCPSGAISVERNPDPPAGSASAPAHPGTSNALPIVNTLRVRENGPLAIEAELLLGGVPQAVPRATLCRCGASARKPLCDNSHRAAGFEATGEPPDQPFSPLPARNGPVNVEPLPDGPLHLTGNLELVSGTGRTFDKTTDTYLCRCGASRRKPWCDGSHKAAGFRAP